MHIITGTRGILHDSERYFRDLSAQGLPFTYWANPQTQEGKQSLLLQVRVCPIQLWDISFPEECRDVMLTTLFPNGHEGMGFNRKLLAMGLQAAMGLKPLPKEWNKTNRIFTPSSNLNIEMFGIGMKEDVFIKPKEDKGIEQI